MDLYINYDEYCNSRNNLSKYDMIWKENFASRKVRGDCSYLYTKFKPVSYEDFYKKYVQDGNSTYNNRKNIDSYNRGRSEEEILTESIRFYNMIKDEYPNDVIRITDCINVYIGRTIHDTFDGHYIENLVDKLLAHNGYTTSSPQGDSDSLYGIDRYCYRDGTLKFLVQVKPMYFFKDNKYKNKIIERKYAFEKEAKAEKVFNVPIYYVVYKRDKLDNKRVSFLTNGNNFAFKLNQLCNPNGLVNDNPYKGFVFKEFNNV